MCFSSIAHDSYLRAVGGRAVAAGAYDGVRKYLTFMFMIIYNIIKYQNLY